MGTGGRGGAALLFAAPSALTAGAASGILLPTAAAAGAAERLAPCPPLFPTLLPAPCILVAAAAGIFVAPAAPFEALHPGTLVLAIETAADIPTSDLLLIWTIRCGNGFSRSAISCSVIVWGPFMNFGHLVSYRDVRTLRCAAGVHCVLRYANQSAIRMRK